jgi:hypothetical protein
MPAGPMRDLLEATANRCGQRVDHIYLWETKSLRLANAFFTGLAWPFRSVFVSDELLRILSPQEVEAVMAHELGHARHRHLWIMLLFLMAMPLIATTLTVLVAGPVPPNAICPLDPTALDPARSTSPTTNIIALVGVVAWIWLGFGLLSRRLERQADEFAAKHVGAEAISSALYRLGQQRPASMFKSGWRHFSIARRIRELMIRSHSSDNSVAAELSKRWTQERHAVILFTALMFIAGIIFHASTVADQYRSAEWHVPVVMAEYGRVTGEADVVWKAHLAEADTVLTYRFEAAKAAKQPLSHDEAMQLLMPWWGVRALQGRATETVFDVLSTSITTPVLRNLDIAKATTEAERMAHAVSAALERKQFVSTEWLRAWEAQQE